MPTENENNASNSIDFDKIVAEILRRQRRGIEHPHFNDIPVVAQIIFEEVASELIKQKQRQYDPLHLLKTCFDMLEYLANYFSLNLSGLVSCFWSHRYAVSVDPLMTKEHYESEMLNQNPNCLGDRRQASLVLNQSLYRKYHGSLLDYKYCLSRAGSNIQIQRSSLVAYEDDDYVCGAYTENTTATTLNTSDSLAANDTTIQQAYKSDLEEFDEQSTTDTSTPKTGNHSSCSEQGSSERSNKKIYKFFGKLNITHKTAACLKMFQRGPK